MRPLYWILILVGVAVVFFMIGRSTKKVKTLTTTTTTTTPAVTVPVVPTT